MLEGFGGAGSWRGHQHVIQWGVECVILLLLLLLLRLLQRWLLMQTHTPKPLISMAYLGRATGCCGVLPWHEGLRELIKGVGGQVVTAAMPPWCLLCRRA